MNKQTPIEEIRGCPFCGKDGSVDLQEEKRTHVVKNNVYEGMFLFYKCDECGKQFTTEKSDTISLERFKPKKK